MERVLYNLRDDFVRWSCYILYIWIWRATAVVVFEPEEKWWTRTICRKRSTRYKNSIKEFNPHSHIFLINWTETSFKIQDDKSSGSVASSKRHFFYISVSCSTDMNNFNDTISISNEFLSTWSKNKWNWMKLREKN